MKCLVELVSEKKGKFFLNHQPFERGEVELPALLSFFAPNFETFFLFDGTSSKENVLVRKFSGFFQVEFLEKKSLPEAIFQGEVGFKGSVFTYTIFSGEVSFSIENGDRFFVLEEDSPFEKIDSGKFIFVFFKKCLYVLDYDKDFTLLKTIPFSTAQREGQVLTLNKNLETSLGHISSIKLNLATLSEEKVVKMKKPENFNAFTFGNAFFEMVKFGGFEKHLSDELSSQKEQLKLFLGDFLEIHPMKENTCCLFYREKENFLISRVFSLEHEDFLVENIIEL